MARGEEVEPKVGRACGSSGGRGCRLEREEGGKAGQTRLRRQRQTKGAMLPPRNPLLPQLAIADTPALLCNLAHHDRVTRTRLAARWRQGRRRGTGEEA